MTREDFSAKDAAKRAMEEVTGPVIAIVLVLCAVFVPVDFLGRHYRRVVQTVCHYHCLVGRDFRIRRVDAQSRALRAGAQAGQEHHQGFWPVQSLFVDASAVYWTVGSITALGDCAGGFRGT